MDNPATQGDVPVANYSARALVLCLSGFPLFLLVIKGWMGGILGLALLLSLSVVIRVRRLGQPLIPPLESKLWVLVFVGVFALPVIGVFLGQLFRHDFSWAMYDSPARFALSIPIMLAILHCRFEAAGLINWAIPGAVFFALISVLFIPNHNQVFWGNERITTYFVDPLTFGSLSLMLGLLCLVSINQFGTESGLSKLLKILACLAGLYLSVSSGSRTGWLALPVVVLLWLGFLPFRHRQILMAFGFLATLLVSAAMYHFSPIVQQRIDLGLTELLSYQWRNPNPVSSIGDRISFIRVAFYLFAQDPLGGWGDTGFRALLDVPELSIFTLPETRDFVVNSGFHNEIATNMVRSGIWGFISSFSLLFLPLFFFLSRLFSSSKKIRGLAFYGVVFMTCVLINGMSTEVFNLKFTASFYALMLASLLGAIFVAEQPNHLSKSHEKN